MSDTFEKDDPATPDYLPAAPDVVGLPSRALFAGIAEAPYGEREARYRIARDATYLDFANSVLAMPEDRPREERTAALELVGSAVAAVLPTGHPDFYYFGDDPHKLAHSLNVAELALRLEQIRSKGYQLAMAGGRVHGQTHHLDESFPPKPLGEKGANRWQWAFGERYMAKQTCLAVFDPESLPKHAVDIGRRVFRNAAEPDLLRAAQIYTDVCLFQLFAERQNADDVIDRDVAALAALRTPGRERQLTDEALLAELNKLEIRLRATGIVRIGIPKYGEPRALVDYGEFVFDPTNCDEQGVPHGLTAEEAERVRGKHLRNIAYMAENARDRDSRPGYAELLAKYQPQPETS